MDPLDMSVGEEDLAAIPSWSVFGSLGMTEMAIAAYDEVADGLRGLQQDLERLHMQMFRILTTLKVLASDTKDRGFKRLLEG